MIIDVPNGRSPAIAAWLCARRIELTGELDRLDDRLWGAEAALDLADDNDEWIERMRARTAYELDCIDEALFRISADPASG